MPTEHLTTLWEVRGAELARPDGPVAGRSAVIVIGRDPEAAAHVAIGLGRAESERRRVAIGDLVGDVPPLVAMLDADDVHGLVDTFLYGVSLNKVAHPVAGNDNLFVLPSGTEPVVTEEIFRSERWRRLASGFREVGALLLLVAPSDARGLDALAAMLDGVITVGDDAATSDPRFAVLATVTSATPMASPAIAEVADVRRGSARSSRARRPVVLPSATPEPARRRWLLPLLLLVLALAAGAYAALWLRDRQREDAAREAARRDSVARAAAAATSAPAAPAAPDTLAMTLVPTNPGDSATASAWAIELAKFMTVDGARISAQKPLGIAPVTWFPVRLGNDPDTRWFRAVAGAWTTRAGADSALATLDASKVLDLPVSVLHAPLALLLREHVGPDSLRVLTARFVQAGIAAYALRQPDGTYNLYTGAFETPDQAVFAALAVQNLGVVQTLVYRKGRAP